MTWTNVGASYADMSRVPTKRALKQAIKAGEVVIFDQTAVLARGPHTIRSDEIPLGVTLAVVGPDPYHDRRWYACVFGSGDTVTVK